jgi:hypothetical protein
MTTFRVVLRHGPKVEKLRTDSLEAALELVERRAREIAAGPGRESIDLHVRRFEPVQQVVARAEIRAVGARAGVDVRGDGSVEAWIGRRIRRWPIEPREGEDAYAALRREMTGQSTSVEP